MLMPSMLWLLDVADVAQRGQQILECGNLIGFAAAWNLAGPAGDERYADAAFVRRALVAAERSGRIEESRNRFRPTGRTSGRCRS